MNKRLFLIIGVLVLAALACSFDLGSLTGSADSSAASNVLFQDDFSDVNSGWDRSAFDSGATDYENDAYRIVVSQPSYSVWANPYQSFTDVRVEVDATKSAGPDLNEFGIICRYRDENNFYVGVLGSDGFYGFWKRYGGAELEPIGDGFQEASDAINLGGSRNHIRLDCIGDTLSLYANGTLVFEVHDADITSGDVGLYAGTFDEAGTDILFDNFFVYQP